MNESSFEMIFKMRFLQEKIDECNLMSFRMKFAAGLCLLVDFIFARKGDSIVVIITLITLIIFFAINMFFLKKRQEYVIQLDNIKKESQDDSIHKLKEINYPFRYYLVIATLMILWFINIR